MGRVRSFVSRHYGITQVVVVVAAHRGVRAPASCDDPELGDRGAARAGRRLVGALAAHRVGGRAAADVPAAARARAGDERLLLRRALRAHGHLLLLALPHATATGFSRFRNGFLAATFIALVIHWRFPTAPPRLADVGLEDTLRSLSNIDIGSPTSSSFSNPVAAVPVAARRLGARRRHRPRHLRAPALLEARRRLLPDRGRPDDRRHRQPLRLRRARRDARDGLGFWFTEWLRRRPGSSPEPAARRA